MNKKLIIYAVLLTFMIILPLAAQGEQDIPVESKTVEVRGPLSDWTAMYSPDQVESAVFAGGCFWGVEAVFEQIEGVLDVDSGYAGGTADTAFYKAVGSGSTGHAESVEIIFDPEKVSYKTLLEVFFLVAHDPTQLNFQGPDKGSEYRSVVFYQSPGQRQITEDTIMELEKNRVYKDDVVTELAPLDAFYPAEDYHQDFLRLNPEYPYIVYWDLPKLQDLNERFPELIARDKH